MIAISDETRPTTVFTSLEDWYETSYRRLHSCLHGATGSADEASDALQEALVTAVAQWPRVSRMDSPDAWIYTVALNAHRRRQRRARVLERLLPVITPRDASNTARIPASEVWPLVAALPDSQRIAVALRHLGGLTEPEIATAMNTTRGSVSATLRAAHARLRPQLAIDDSD